MNAKLLFRGLISAALFLVLAGGAIGKEHDKPKPGPEKPEVHEQGK